MYVKKNYREKKITKKDKDFALLITRDYIC